MRNLLITAFLALLWSLYSCTAVPAYLMAPAALAGSLAHEEHCTVVDIKLKPSEEEKN